MPILAKIRKLDARFRVNGFQEFVEVNASAPTAQLQGIRLFLDVIVSRKWNFRATDVSRAFSSSVPLKRDACLELLDGVEKDNVARKLLKPLYGLSTACKDWYNTIRDFLSHEFGGGGSYFPR